MKLDTHPTVLAVRKASPTSPPATLDADWLRDLCLEAGADDVGFVEVERPALSGERPHAEAALPGTRMLIGFACRMNLEPIRSPARSVANLEFHHTGDKVNEIGRSIVTALERRGVRA